MGAKASGPKPWEKVTILLATIAETFQPRLQLSGSFGSSASTISLRNVSHSATHTCWLWYEHCSSTFEKVVGIQVSHDLCTWQDFNMKLLLDAMEFLGCWLAMIL